MNESLSKVRSTKIGILALAAIAVWSYVGYRLWFIADDAPDVATEETENRIALNRNGSVMSGAHTFTGNFRDPFLSDYVEAETLPDVVDATTVDDQKPGPVSVAPTIRLIGIIGKTAIVQSANEQLSMVTSTDSINSFAVTSVGDDHIILEKDQQTITLSLSQDTDRLEIARNHE